MLPSDKVFSCHLCAAQPVNQKLQGCFEPAPRPNIILKDFAFEMCPLAYQSKSAYLVMRAHQDGLLNATYETKIRTPAKLLAGVHYIDFLKKLREAHDY